MHRREQLKPVRSLEAVDEMRDAIEALLKLRLTTGIPRPLRCAWYEIEHDIGGSPSPVEAGDQVSLDFDRGRGGGSRRTARTGLREAKLSGSPRLLQEVHELVHLEQGDRRIEQPARYRDISPTSAARPGGHLRQLRRARPARRREHRGSNTTTSRPGTSANARSISGLTRPSRARRGRAKRRDRDRANLARLGSRR